MSIISKSDNGISLQNYVAKKYDLSKSAAKKLIDSRSVRVNARPVWMARHILKTGDVVDIPSTRFNPEPSPLKLSTIYVNQHVFVFNKPPGITTTGSKSFEVLCQREHKNTTLRAVHRLDKDTSGCVLFSDCQPTTQGLISQFKHRKVKKEYTAIVLGKTSFSSRTVRQPIAHQDATTHITVQQISEQFSRVSCLIETGRKHQIRIHLAGIGHPVAGDLIYRAPHTKQVNPAMYNFPRIMLHATRLGLKHPANNAPIQTTAPLPHDILEEMRTHQLTSP